MAPVPEQRERIEKKGAFSPALAVRKTLCSRYHLLRARWLSNQEILELLVVIKIMALVPFDVRPSRVILLDDTTG